ncbi:hypothetical protein CC78DRAFT_579821 [Lojkania enalia]|uniref:Uncharacterized protein n=1 Tax=Lojkania enalia TaxID=147567 RepID=A0A9P4KCG8_9PLEO|nr:hypothetical protein CC78DRAFT_579821 [Didymosphaeria enalia]
MSQLSTTALTTILTGVGVVMMGLLIGLGFLLFRAVRTHKRLLADLNERGIAIDQAQAQDARASSITKLHAVLQRNAILPFNTKSGWDTLPSQETISQPEPASILSHYEPPKPPRFMGKSTRLSWSFSARREPGKAIHLRKIRVPILSTVLESPKPSPLVPALSRPQADPPSPRKSQCRPSSDQSLFQRHPAFRNDFQERSPESSTTTQSEPLWRSLDAKSIPKTERWIGPNRSTSAAEIPMTTNKKVVSQISRPKLHERSASLCSQSFVNAPGAGLSPLPLKVARIKSDARRSSLLIRSPPRLSVSNLEPAGSSVIYTQSSPILSHSHDLRVQEVSKRHWRSSLIAGPRPIRDTLTLYEKNQGSHGSIKSAVTRFSKAAMPNSRQSQAESRNSTLTNSSSVQSTMSKLSSPACRPLTVRSFSTPRRQSGSYVTAYGSPQERRRTPAGFHEVSENSELPTRQLSQASTQASSIRSSNGNPFQWDPAPYTVGKPPSALKGSPSARKGHKRQNCVRISTQLTILGETGRPNSPPGMNDIQEESPDVSLEKRVCIGPGFSSARSLPQPPGTSILAPDVKLSTPNIRAALKPSSPTLSMANYDHGSIGSLVVGRPGQNSVPVTTHDGNRASTGSLFSTPSFPSPCHGTRSSYGTASRPLALALSRPSNKYREGTGASDPSPNARLSPFGIIIPNFSSAVNQPLLTEEYDPEHPHLVYQTPASSPTQQFSSPFSTTPEELSATLTRTMDYELLQSNDSSPCSPKTIRSHAFLPTAQNRSPPNRSIMRSTISEEPCPVTIDPAILSNDRFNVLNSPFHHRPSILSNGQNGRDSVLMPTSLTSAKLTFEPLLEVTFPSSPPVAEVDNSPASKQGLCPTHVGLELPLRSNQSSPSSMYSASPGASPSLSPLPPCSPRPQHAQLPAPALNFAQMPKLSPFPPRPRDRQTKSLHQSIEKLRRMNSDAKRSGYGEQRYLRLGHEDSTVLPGGENRLEDLGVGGGEDQTWDEKKGRMLIGDMLDNWEEEATMLDLQDTQAGKDQNDKGVTARPKNDSLEKKAERPSSGICPLSSPKENRSSRIWEDGEKFWHSTPPIPPTSSNKPQNTFQPFYSSPAPSLTSTKSPRKREFEVSNDESPDQRPERLGTMNGGRKIAVGNRYRKKSVLGLGSPNARIQVQPPSNAGTPGSLYDGDGFLRD